MARLITFYLLLSLAGDAFAGEAMADEAWRDWPLYDRFRVSVGLYDVDVDTRTKVSEVGGFEGTRIDLEDDLGLDDELSTWFASIEWRFTKRNKFSLNYYRLERDGSVALPRDIFFKGESYAEGTEVESFIDVDVYELSYSYSLVFSERINLSVGGGVALQDYEVAVSGVDSSGPGREEGNTALLPTLNVDFQYAFNDKWALILKGGWLEVDLVFRDSDVDGRILAGTAGVNWRPLENLGFTVAYKYFQLDSELGDDAVETDLTIDYRGPGMTVNLYF